MKIRKSTIKDFAEISKIFNVARKYMIENKNETQWANGYPDEQTIKSDISDGNSYIIEENGKIVGVFTFIFGDEPTYKIIKNGAWHYTKIVFNRRMKITQNINKLIYNNLIFLIRFLLLPRFVSNLGNDELLA